jgi:hypothetical protein
LGAVLVLDPFHCSHIVATATVTVLAKYRTILEDRVPAIVTTNSLYYGGDVILLGGE